MALDPEKRAPKAEGSPSDAQPAASGPAADDGSTALLQQIARHLSALTSQVTELQSELEEVREESAAIREQTGAPKTKRLAYLGNRPTEQPATPGPEPVAGEEPVADSAEQMAEEPVAESEVSPSRLYSKQCFADDFEEAMTNVEEVSWEDRPENEETVLLPDEQPFITEETLSEMEREHPKAKSMISQFNEENPSDFVQDDVTSSTGQPRTAEPDPAPRKPVEEAVGADVTDDERQALQSAAPEQKSETPPEQESASGTPISDEDVQKLLAKEAEQAAELHPEAKPEQAAGGAEEPSDDQGQEPQAEAQEPPTAEPDDEHEPEQAADSDEDVTDAEIQQLLAGVAEGAKEAAEPEAAGEKQSPISEDELQEPASETREAAADAPPIEPMPPQSSGESEDETVEVGFTAFQAGKEVGDETAEEPEEWPVKQRREVVQPTFEVDPEAVAKVPAHLAIAALAVPVRVDETELVLRVAEPIDRIAFDIIGDATAMKVKPEPAPMEEVLAALRNAYGSDSCPEERQAVAGVAPRELAKGVEKRSRRAFRKVRRR